MTIIKSLEDLESLFRLMDECRIDSVELEGMKVTKSQWNGPLVMTTRPASDPTDADDLLYYASDD